MVIAYLIPAIGIIVSVLMASESIDRHQHLRRTTLYRNLSFMVRQNLPLIPALYTASHGQPTAIRFALRRMSRLLESGIPLSDAIALGWPKCPTVDQSFLQAAERAGTLPDALAVIEARYQREFNTHLTTDRGLIAPPLITLVVFVLVYLLAGVFVIPSLKVIFEDHGATLPLFSHEIMIAGFWGYSQPLTWYGFLFHMAFNGMILVVAVCAFANLVASFHSRIEFFSNLADSICWFIPPLRRAAVAEGCVLTLPLLRIATAAGWPLDRAADFAATVRANVNWRQKLENWAGLIRSGNDAIEAGRSARLPDMLLRYLAVGMRDGNLEAPLATTEQYFALLLERHRRAVRGIIWFVLTLTVGLIVGCVCAAVFLAMAELINTTAEYWWQL